MTEQPTCTYRNTAVKKVCEKPAVAWSPGMFSLGSKVYFCAECLDRAKTKPVNAKREFHRISRGSATR